MTMDGSRKARRSRGVVEAPVRPKQSVERNAPSRARFTVVRAFGLGLLSVVLLGTFWLKHALESHKPASILKQTAQTRVQQPVSRGGRCVFRERDRLTYRVERTMRSEIDLRRVLGKGPGGSRSQAALSADLSRSLELKSSWRLDLEARHVSAEGSTILAAKISEHTVHGLAEPEAKRFSEALSPVFLVRLASSCAVEAFARRSDAELRGALAQQSLTIVLQWQFPPVHGAARYTAKERNATGEYLARYVLETAERAAAANGAHPRSIVERRIDVYTRLFHASNPRAASEVRLGAGRRGLRVEPGAGPWFERLDDREVSTHVSGQAVFARTVEETHARRVIESSVPTLSVDANAPDWLWGDLFEVVSPEPVEQQSAVSQEIQRLSLAGLLAQLQAKAADPSLKIEPWLALARDWIRAHPEQIADLLLALQNGRIPAEFVRPALFLAMRMTELSAAKQALYGVYADPKYDHATRIQAAISLAGAKDLPEGFVEEVARNAVSPSDRSLAADNFRRHSVATLGSIAREQTGRNPALAKLASDRLTQQLHAARSTTEIKDLLNGVGNAGTRDLFSEVTRYMASDDAHLRRAAASALRAMPPDVSASSYGTWLSREKSPVVRGELVHAYFVQSVDSGGAPPPSVVRASVETLATEPDAHVKRELVQLVGRAAASGDTSAKAALADCFRTEMRKPERDVALLQELGRHVSPGELNNAGSSSK